MTLEERINRLETSQTSAWEAIAALAKDHASLYAAQLESQRGLAELRELVASFIRSMKNGSTGSTAN